MFLSEFHLFGVILVVFGHREIPISDFNCERSIYMFTIACLTVLDVPFLIIM